MNTSVIEGAIREITEQIAERQEAVKVLQGLLGSAPRGTSELRITNHDLRAENSRGPKVPRRARLVRTEAPAAGRRRRGELDGVVAKLAEPFTAQDIAKAGGVEGKKAQNFCTRACALKRIERVGHGQYRRTKGFNGVALLEEIHREIEAAKPKDD